MDRIVVGAHYGIKDWLAQRITAIVMAVYSVFIGVALACGGASSFDSWRALMSGSLARFATFLFIISVCYHAWVGVRNIWMDYVKPVGWRLFLHMLTILVLTGCAGWAVQILWRL